MPITIILPIATVFFCYLPNISDFNLIKKDSTMYVIMIEESLNKNNFIHRVSNPKL